MADPLCHCGSLITVVGSIPASISSLGLFRMIFATVMFEFCGSLNAHLKALGFSVASSSSPELAASFATFSFYLSLTGLEQLQNDHQTHPLSLDCLYFSTYAIMCYYKVLLREILAFFFFFLKNTL